MFKKMLFVISAAFVSTLGFSAEPKITDVPSSAGWKLRSECSLGLGSLASDTDSENFELEFEARRLSGQKIPLEDYENPITEADGSSSPALSKEEYFQNVTKIYVSSKWNISVRTKAYQWGSFVLPSVTIEGRLKWYDSHRGALLIEDPTTAGRLISVNFTEIDPRASGYMFLRKR